MHLHTITTFVFYDGKYGTTKISYIKGNGQDVEEELSISKINSDVGVPMVLITNQLSLSKKNIISKTFMFVLFNPFKICIN